MLIMLIIIGAGAIKQRTDKASNQQQDIYKVSSQRHQYYQPERARYILILIIMSAHSRIGAHHHDSHAHAGCNRHARTHTRPTYTHVHTCYEYKYEHVINLIRLTLYVKHSFPVRYYYTSQCICSVLVSFLIKIKCLYNRDWHIPPAMWIN